MRNLALSLLLIVTLCACATRPSASPGSASAAARAAIADLAKSEGLPEAEITVVSETSASWPDACLGCARKGEMCAQVITPGSRVLLLARGVTREYHADRSGHVRPCP